MADRTVRLVLTGSSAAAIAALEQVGIKAEEAGAKTEAAFGDKLAGTVEGTSGVFAKLAGAFAGVPLIGAFFEKSAEKIGDADTKGKAFGQTLSEVGKVAALAGAAGIAAVAGESLKMGINFQQSVASMAATAGIPVAAAQKIGSAFLSTAGQSTFSGQQMTQAYAPVAAQLASVQGHALSAKEALTVMKAATDLAEASGGDLASTTASLAAVMQAYGLKAGDAAKASDVLYNVSRLTNTPISSLTTVLDRLKGRLGTLAPSLADVGTLMAFPAVASQGSRGAMVVNTALQTLIGGSKNTKAELASLGVNIFDASGKFVGMRDVIGQLQPKLAAMTDQQRDAAEKTLFGAGAAQLMGSVMAGGVSAYDNAAAAVTKVGSAHEAAEKQASTFKGTMEKLKATGEDLGAKLGMLLIPMVQRLGQIVAQVTNFLIQHKTIAMALAIVIGGILLAATVAWTISLFAAGGALAFLMSPITLIVAGIALLVLGIIEMVKHWTEIWSLVKRYSIEIAAALIVILGPIGLIIAIVLLLATHWKAVFDFVKAAPGEAWQFIDTTFVQPVERFFSSVVGFIESHWKLILAILTGPIGLAALFINEHFQAVLDFFTGIPGKMAAIGAHMWDWVSGGFKMVIDTLIGWWNDFVGYLKIPGFKIGVGPIHYTFGGIDFGSSLKIPMLASGGLVTSEGLAYIHDGEQVVPAAKTRPLGAAGVEGGPGGSGGDLVLQLDGRELGRILAPYLRTALLQGTARNSKRVGLA